MTDPRTSTFEDRFARTERDHDGLSGFSSLIRALWCGFWIAVAALHFYLVAKRLFLGQWNSGMDQARMILALAGALYGVYGTIKIGSILRALDRSPRKFLAALLAVFLLHLAIVPTERSSLADSPNPDSSWAYVILTVPLATGLFLIGAVALIERSRSSQIRKISAYGRFELDFAFPSPVIPAPLRQRPPPSGS